MKWFWLFLLFVYLPLHDTYVDNTISLEQCISAVVESEASGESLAGMRAVMDVVLERMRRQKAHCTVVALSRGQFTGMSWKKIIETKTLTSYSDYATMKPVCEKCTHFSRVDAPRKNWMDKFKFRKRIGLHNFWEEKL